MKYLNQRSFIKLHLFTHDKMPLRKTEHSSCPRIKALHAFCNRFQLKNLFCLKTTIIAVMENHKQYNDDNPVQKEKKHQKVEEIFFQMRSLLVTIMR